VSLASDQGFDPARLARIDTLLKEKYIGPGRMACAQFVLSRRGQVVHRVTLGMRDLARSAPCEDDTLFRIYSMTKPLTSAALMMLVEEAAIALDDPVHRYLPSWRDQGVFVAGAEGGWQTRPPESPVRVVDLLRHTAGLTYGFQFRSNVDAAYRRLQLTDHPGSMDLETMCDTLGGLPLEFDPGQAWNYSVATDVVGRLIEVVSGTSFQDFLRTRLLEPLGMADTGFHVPDAARNRLSACYVQTPDGRLRVQDDPETSAYHHPPRLYSGGGGLVGTADDYLKFCQMMLNGGALNGRRFLSPRTVALMSANHLPGGQDLTEVSRSLFSESTYAGVGFGLGFAVVDDPARTLLPVSKGEYYWGGMASTAFWIDPAEDIAAVFMTQLMPADASNIRRELRTLVYSALVEPNAARP
jgi:CubicO group peptidase (beta-lactamase class C family)